MTVKELKAKLEGMNEESGVGTFATESALLFALEDVFEIRPSESGVLPKDRAAAMSGKKFVSMSDDFSETESFYAPL